MDTNAKSGVNEAKQAGYPSDLRGNTLRVYLFLLRNGPSELREVQRALNLSSPSLASYHLSKLVKLEYVAQDVEGRYSAIKDASPDILEGYTKIGAALVPQLFFFSVLFTVLSAYFGYKSLTAVSYTPDLVGVSVAMVVLLWWETLRLMRRLVTMS
ncbi:MAG: helix-turn-helix domain-containing protein [Candidatus Marsarchaeota archaeon]|nr:helix-turn-helix domain-containing protein [Candidatus Marsarchaeota archaeon]